MHNDLEKGKKIDRYVQTGIKIVAVIITLVLLRGLFIPAKPVPAPVVEKVVAPDYTTASGKPPEFVVFAFDGSKSIDMWKNTISFADEMKQKGSPIKFTYFVSGVYFIDAAEKDIYQPPRAERGASLIGFGDSDADVKDRVQEVDEAFKDGHEIASHAGGHFNGVSWTYDEWKQEFASFDSLLSFHRNDATFGTTTLTITKKDITGFRAPVLGINENAMKAMKDSGYRYDTSEIGLPSSWPKKNAEDIWEFPLGTIYPAGRSPTISMDYSIYMQQTGAHDLAIKNTPLWDSLYKETYDAYMKYFTSNYDGDRAPVFIGHHFSLWNDGLYWEIMKSVARDVCGKPEVRCTTYTELANYLDQLPPEKLASLQKNDWKNDVKSQAAVEKAVELEQPTKVESE